MIQTKRIYDPASKDDGKRILVDRLWPRGIKKEEAAVDDWLKDIAPSADLRKWFSHDPSKWQEFRKEYRKELRGKDKSELLAQLRRAAGKGKVTILFAAKDIDHNNAVVLKELLEEQAAGKEMP